jgi:hypothetical protein
MAVQPKIQRCVQARSIARKERLLERRGMIEKLSAASARSSSTAFKRS